MQFSQLPLRDQEALLAELGEMPDLLAFAFSELTPAEKVLPGPGGAFSPVEQFWHLADLEREGYAARIRLLLDENEPALADFDGARVARERNYKMLSLVEGLEAFRAARVANLIALRTVQSDGWSRSGAQEGVGVVTLGELPHMMAEHDAEHRQEINAWLRMRNDDMGPG